MEEQLKMESSFREGPPLGSSPPSFLMSSNPSSRIFQSEISQRLRSQKPPEPLRRAVADCLSSSHHGTPSPLALEAARTLRDYLVSSSTTDMAYNVLLDHALAERDRSPAVVLKCVALLKRYLLRYMPREQTLQQIDQFCVTLIAECDSLASRRVSPILRSSNHRNEASPVPTNAFSPSFHASTFSSGMLVKSINYVRGLVARHIPRRLFQPPGLAGAFNASNSKLPTLSSLMSRSFSSQLSPRGVSSRGSPETKEVAASSSKNSSGIARLYEVDDNYLAVDVLKWRWSGGHDLQPSVLSHAVTNSGDDMKPQVSNAHNFVEVGAATLRVGDVELKTEAPPGKYYDRLISEVDLDQLLQPSTVTAANNIASARAHLRAITASKRMVSGPHQVWDDAPTNTFRMRARPLFQYRYYSEQQPLRLTSAEVEEVIAAVCSEASVSSANLMPVSSKLTNYTGKQTMDVAVSVLIKLVIDMYMVDPKGAAPLTLSMLEEMLLSPKLTSRVRAFDLILNLGVHAHLLEPMLSDIPSTIEEEESSHEPEFSADEQLESLGQRCTRLSEQQNMPSAIESFESWLLNILHEILLLLVQIEEKEEAVWASALSCLLYMVCDRGKILRGRLEGLDIRVIKVLLEVSRESSWAEALHCKLICIFVNMFYKVASGPDSVVLSTPVFSIELVDLLGGIDLVCLEYSRANTMEEKRNLFALLLDYVVHQLNETCLAREGFMYGSDEIQPIAAMLTILDAPEAFHVSVKYGLEGVGGLLRRSTSATMSRSAVSGHFNSTLLEDIMKMFDTIITSVTHTDEEFVDMLRMTKAFKSLESIEKGCAGVSLDANEVKQAWATLHSLLHSQNTAYRQNGYIWLSELLVWTLVYGDMGNDIRPNIKKLQREIEIVKSQDSKIGSTVSLPTWIWCGLLKSKYNYIRWGFLVVLEKLLVRCQLLLNENDVQQVPGGDDFSEDHSNTSLDKAKVVIGIMNSALSLVVSISETDRITILKMCDLLFSQLCLKLHPPSEAPTPKVRSKESPNDLAGRDPFDGHLAKKPLGSQSLESSRSTLGSHMRHADYSTASMAALLLRGHASVPMQLVACVYTPLFFWPLIQLADAVTDDIALGVSVGSKGRGSLPGSVSDIRAALLLLLIGKCTADHAAFSDVGGEEFFRSLLDDSDARVAYYTSAFLLKRLMMEKPETYQRTLHNLVFRAQQSNNEKLLENPYLQMRGIIQLSNDMGSQL
ncbi:hypothetical protein AMTRI_Chr08g204570 [Amborella trichopoda]